MRISDWSSDVCSSDLKAAAWFEPGPLAEAVDRVLTISSGKTRAIAMEFAAEAVTLQVISTENGTASEDVPCEYDGDPLRIGFNGAYLLDVLRHLKGTDAEGTRAREIGRASCRERRCPYG